MLNVRRLSCVWTLLLCSLATLAATTAKAQESQHPTLERQLDRVDLSVSGVGQFNRDSSGTAIVEAVPTTVNLTTGNTLGALVTLRYTKAPFLGLEFNYGYARYTDTFTPFGILPPPGQPAASAGYLRVHGRLCRPSTAGLRSQTLRLGRARHPRLPANPARR